MCVLFLGLAIFFGVKAWIILDPSDLTSQNPYLRTSLYKPVYTILLPLILSLYVGSEISKDYYKNHKILSVDSE
jgi:hypothetical protein